MEDTTQNNPFTLPSLIARWSLPSTGTDDHQFYDVKFYPYSDDCPVFAMVGCRDILIRQVDENGYTNDCVILRDEEEIGPEKLPILNTCSWAYVDEANPLLAVSGSSGQIKLIEVCSGSLFTTLIGHGTGLVNDLATHPTYPWILASASIDESIRIWDLRRLDDKYESPCIIICGQGHGHHQGLLSIAWHLSGRYIVSGAHDNAVCVWTIPDLSDMSEFWVTISPASRKRTAEAVHVIRYPHFVTSSVHSNYVDCVCFFGDMILSKAASDPGERNKIVLWEITGFDSKLPPPLPDSAPKTEEYKETRSGFNRKRESLNNVQINDEPANAEDQPARRQHLEFDLLNTPYFYQRFGLLTPSRAYPNLNPVLVCGNANAQIFMWDLKRLQLGHTYGYQTLPKGGPRQHETYIELTKRRQIKQEIGLGKQPLSKHTFTTVATGELASHPQAVPDRERYPIADPFNPIKPHKIITLSRERKGDKTTFRGGSWSSCGSFYAAVGGRKGEKNAQGALLSRWKNGTDSITG